MGMAGKGNLRIGGRVMPERKWEVESNEEGGVVYKLGDIVVRRATPDNVVRP